MRTIVGGAPAPVVWFRLPANWPVYDQPTIFRSRNYLADHYNVGMGEQDSGETCCGRRDLPWYRGNAPAPYTSTRPCGSVEVGKRGATPGVDPVFMTDSSGVAPCCKTAIPWTGGEAEGGRFPGGNRYRPAWTGAEAEGGSWTATVPYYGVWTGGEAEGGSWTHSITTQSAWTGAEAEGGAWWHSITAQSFFHGGEAEGGAWTPGYTPATSWTGGEAEGGAATAGFFPATSWTGGEAEGGAFPADLFPSPAWVGGEAEGGAFPGAPPYAPAWTGAEAEGGSWTATAPYPAWWTGGEAEGGAATAGKVNLFPFGGEGEGGSWAQGRTPGFAATGGEGEGGSWQQILAPPYTATGGEGEGGSWAQGIVSGLAAGGGEGEGGSWQQGLGPSLHATGGEGEGGSWAQGYLTSFRATGGEGEGGSWSQSAHVNILATGGEGEGGSWQQGYKVDILATGGEGEGGSWTLGPVPTPVVIGYTTTAVTSSGTPLSLWPSTQAGDLLLLCFAEFGPSSSSPTFPIGFSVQQSTGVPMGKLYVAWRIYSPTAPPAIMYSTPYYEATALLITIRYGSLLIGASPNTYNSSAVPFGTLPGLTLSSVLNAGVAVFASPDAVTYSPSPLYFTAGTTAPGAFPTITAFINWGYTSLAFGPVTVGISPADPFGAIGVQIQR